MKHPPSTSRPSPTPRLALAKRALACLSLSLLSLLTLISPAQASAAQTGIEVTLPNGNASLDIDDLRLKTPAGDVRWRRVWDGTEWKFNPHWENLTQSWKNLTGSQTADTTAGTGGTGSNVGNEVYGQAVTGAAVGLLAPALLVDAGVGAFIDTAAANVGIRVASSMGGNLVGRRDGGVRRSIVSWWRFG